MAGFGPSSLKLCEGGLVALSSAVNHLVGSEPIAWNGGYTRELDPVAGPASDALFDFLELLIIL